MTDHSPASYVRGALDAIRAENITDAEAHLKRALELLTTVTGSDRRPTALLDTDRANFDTLKRAMENDDVALMHVREKATGHGHALLCIMSNPQDGSDDVDVIPVARMLDEDPTETYTNPADDVEARDDQPWTCPKCGFDNEGHAQLCHGCGWDSSRP